MKGVLKGINLSLDDGCTYDDDEIELLFINLKTGMQPLTDVKNKNIQKGCMRLFSAHVNLFKKIIHKYAEEMLKLDL